MKKIIYLFVIIGAIMVGCNPIDDINKEIDANTERIIVVDSDNYTLTADDYADLGLTFGSFSSLDDAKTMLPGFLSDTYPTWGQGSSVLVGFNLYIGAAEGVSDYTGAEVYTLTNSDYPQGNLNAIGFYPDENPADFMDAILAAQYPSPVEGQVVMTKYKQYTEQPVEGISNLVNADFKTEQTLLDWTPVSITGDEAWIGTQYGAKMSGRTSPDNHVNEDWLVSPAIDLTTQVNPKFQVTQVLNYSNTTDWYHILVSTDYAGDVTTATWDNIDVTPVPPGTSWTAVTSDDFDFSAYEGQTIYIAFKYESDAVTAATWEIEKTLVKVPGVEGATVDKEVYYTYSGGKWIPSNGVYVLSADDYDSMGTASGQPGRYNNFSSSMPADNYIPTFLSLTSPFSFGQEDAEIIVIYKYYSSSCSCTQTRGNLYTVIDGAWTAHQSTIATSLQFGFVDGQWVPDNTIRYALTVDDFVTIGAAFADIYPTPASSAGNYKNFDRRAGNAAEWTDAMIVEALNVILDGLDPSADEGQKYLVTFAIYNGAAGIEEMGVIKEGGVWVQQ